MNILLKSWNCKGESYEDVLVRYKGFGATLFSQLEHSLPDLFKQLRFYRSTDSHTNDVLAVFENQTKKSFVIQLDPVGETIIIWNDEKTIEIGAWIIDETQEAIGCLKSNFYNS